LATLRLEGATLNRSAVKDDPGFRLQYLFLKAGKEVAVVDARGNPSVEVPRKEAGVYAVVLQAFYPAYKGGKGQRGQFKAVSRALTYRVEGGKVSLVEPPLPVPGAVALVVQCGKEGKLQDDLLSQGYGYKLLQGEPCATDPKSGRHCWQEPKLLRFDVTVPANTAGTLRLHFAGGDGEKRKQRVTVQGKARGDVEGFDEKGKNLDVALTAPEATSGRVEVTIQNLNPSGNAVVSIVEFTPTGAGKP
jgi:hypothetical protein